MRVLSRPSNIEEGFCSLQNSYFFAAGKMYILVLYALLALILGVVETTLNRSFFSIMKKHGLLFSGLVDGWTEFKSVS